MKNSKKQVKDLELWEIDYLVAKTEGKKVKLIDDGKYGKYLMLNDCVYSPTTNPSQAWPIIERERIKISPNFGSNNGWYASKDLLLITNGKTSLEAAMRCYVASKFGDEVEI